MNDKLLKTLIFVAGAAVGAAVMYKSLKDKFEQEVHEEVESVKQAYRDARPNVIPVDREEVEENDKILAQDVPLKYNGRAEKVDYHRISHELGYISEDGTHITQKDLIEVEDPSMLKHQEPYVISPAEFGEMGYDKISLTYFADHVLVDDNYDLIEDVDATVGEGSLETFGEYEDDSVFVRNDILQVDYEILLDYRTFEEFIKTRPHPPEVE